MNIDKLLSELEAKNDDICHQIKATLQTAGLDINKSAFDLLSKKLQNHDKLLVNAISEVDSKIDKIAKSIIKNMK